MSLGAWNNAGSVFVVISLTLAVLGFATNNWLDFTVDAAKFSVVSLPDQTRAAYYGVAGSRNRGLLKECYSVEPGYLASSGRKASSSCAWVEYEIPATSNYSSYSQAYRTRIHCLRLAPISLCIALLLLFLALVMNVFSACCAAERRVALIACVLCLVAFLLMVAALAGFFASFLTYEVKEVKDNWFFWAAWTQNLQAATNYRFDWSLWVTVATLPCTLLAAIFFLVDHKTRDEFGNPRQYKKYKSSRNNRAPNGYFSGPTPYPTDDRTGRVIKQQVLRRTIDPATGRELAPHINDGYDCSDDGSIRPHGRTRQESRDAYRPRQTWQQGSPHKERRTHEGRHNGQQYYY